MKVYGVKKVVGEAKRLQNVKMNWTVYLNKKTNHVWLKEYAGDCSWTEYKDENISPIMTREIYAKEYGGQLSMYKLQLLLDKYLWSYYL